MKVLTRSLRVLVMLGLWASCGTSLALAQTTALYLESQPGDYIGQGQTDSWTSADLTFTASGDPRRIVINAQGSEVSNYWYLTFSAPATAMAPGVYENAVRFASQSSVSPELEVWGQSRRCNTVVGRFVVHEFTLDAEGGVASFAADFEQHCEGATPALFGAIRFNSSRASLLPFDGAYPEYSLTVDAAINGYVTGPGVDCGAGRIDCREEYSPNTSVALHAVPSDGYVFLGWIGDCLGRQDGVVAVRWRRFCAPVFNRLPGSAASESPDYSQGVLFLDGFGMTDGSPSPDERSWRVFAALPQGSPIRSVIDQASFFTNTASRVQFQIHGPGGVQFSLRFETPFGEELTPGVDYRFTSTTSEQTNVRPVLDLTSFSYGLSCTDGGRFTVHEFTFDESTGSVLGFAADFELPCRSNAYLAGSIRYRSTRSSLLPFDGQYPLYTLTIVPTLGGYVTSADISCGDGGRTDCDVIFDSPAVVGLQAVSSPGYQFIAWAGSCAEGNATTAVTVDRIKRCYAAFAPVPGGGADGDPSLARATMLIESLGTTPQTRSIWFGDDARVSLSGDASRVSIDFSSDPHSGLMNIAFRASTGSLIPGDYEYEYSDFNDFSLSNCSVVGVRFRIYELTTDSSGRAVSFAADFEARCRFPNHRMVGAVRFDATRSSIVPFDGAYPIAKLTIQPAMNGIVTGPGIDCGPGRTDCTELLAAPTSLTLQAFPLPGYRFVGWSGRCEGHSITTVTVDWILTCSAVFNAVIPGMGSEDPRLRADTFSFESQSGDPVGGGRRAVWPDAAVIVFAQNRRWINVWVDHPEGDSWQLELRAPLGQELQVTAYENAQSVFGATMAPGLRISSTNGSCSSNLVGRFVIYEITFASTTSSTLTAFAADFEQRCTPGGPWLRVSVRYRSGRSVLKPFAPSVFTPVAGPVRPDINRDGWADLVWRHATNGRNAVWFMNDLKAEMTMSLEPSTAAAVGDLAWEIRAVGDMNGDDSPDLVWQHATTGRMAVWFMSGSRLVGSNDLYTAALSNIEPDLNWKIVAAGDMDRDGHVDLLWRHRTSGQIRLWHMDGIVEWDSVSFGTVSDSNWEISGLADMNQDGMLDLVWRHYGHGSIASWFMYDALVQVTVKFADLADTNWHIVGVVDMNGDGQADLVWQNTSSGGIAVWLMDGITTVGGRYLNPAKVSDPNWRIVGVR